MNASLPMGFELRPGELDAVAAADVQLDDVICGFQLGAFSLTPEQFDLVVAERRRLGRILLEEDVRRVLDAPGAHEPGAVIEVPLGTVVFAGPASRTPASYLPASARGVLPAESSGCGISFDVDGVNVRLKLDLRSAEFLRRALAESLDRYGARANEGKSA
jgi:hypothetical protein